MPNNPAQDFSAYQTQLLQAQRQAKLAEALRQQSFQPIESADSGVLKAPISWTQGLSKMLQAYAANKGEQKSIENTGKASQMQYEMMRNLYGGGQQQQGQQTQQTQQPTQAVPMQSPASIPQSIRNPDYTGQQSNMTPIPSQPSSNASMMPGQPNMTPAPQSPMGMRMPPGFTPDTMAGMSLVNPQMAGQIQSEWMKPDPTTLAAMNAGYTPGQTQDIQRRTLEKGAYIAPLNIRPGSVPGDPYTGMPLPSAPALGAAQAVNAAQIERAKQQNTIFPGMTVGGKEGVPVWGGDIPHMGGGSPGAPGMGGNADTGFGMSPGTKAASGEMGRSGAGRYNDTVKLASESPMRINVLDNIINLSEEGTKTGPGQEWKNKVLGYAANTPALGMILGSQKDEVGKFQELQKFTYQNALRNWQASGGTGTDAQMEAASHANPNDTLFPQALQQIAKWGKASELALQAKANAQDKWLQQNGEDTSKQYQFENVWRQNFDPKVYQMKLMNPVELQQFTAKLPQQERANLLNKYRFAKQNGFIQ